MFCELGNPKVTAHKGTETIQGRKLYEEIRYLKFKYHNSSFVQIYFLSNWMVLKEFKLCKIAKCFKSHCGPDRKQERNGVDLSKMTVTDEIKNEFAGIFLDHQK